MKQHNEHYFTADEGKTIVRKSDQFVMGTGIDLGVNDSIENYEEVELTEENDIEGILKREQEKQDRKSKFKSLLPS